MRTWKKNILSHRNNIHKIKFTRNMEAPSKILSTFLSVFWLASLQEHFWKPLAVWPRVTACCSLAAKPNQLLSLHEQAKNHRVVAYKYKFFKSKYCELHLTSKIPKKVWSVQVRVVWPQLNSGLETSQHDVVRYLKRVSALENIVLSLLIQQF